MKREQLRKTKKWLNYKHHIQFVNLLKRIYLQFKKVMLLRKKKILGEMCEDIPVLQLKEVFKHSKKRKLNNYKLSRTSKIWFMVLLIWLTKNKLDRMTLIKFKRMIMNLKTVRMKEKFIFPIIAQFLIDKEVILIKDNFLQEPMINFYWIQHWNRWSILHD